MAVLGAALTFLSALLILNTIIVVNSYLHPDEVPDAFGFKPLSCFRAPWANIMTGDLVLTREVDPAGLQVGDVIAFREGQSVITHRIIETQQVDGQRQFVTKGDNNNTQDSRLVPYSAVEGKYLLRIGGLGDFAMFLQTPLGLILFVGGAPGRFYYIRYPAPQIHRYPRHPGKRPPAGRIGSAARGRGLAPARSPFAPAVPSWKSFCAAPGAAPCGPAASNGPAAPGGGPAAARGLRPPRPAPRPLRSGRRSPARHQRRPARGPAGPAAGGKPGFESRPQAPLPSGTGDRALAGRNERLRREKTFDAAAPSDRWLPARAGAHR